MPPKPTKHIQTRRGENVHIGPISLITLIIVVCMAVMGVLAASTSHATATISERQAGATQALYLNEKAGQEFVAGVDGVLAGVRSGGGSASAGAAAVNAQLDAICEKVRSVTEDKVTCTALVDGTSVNAEFTCDQARQLSVSIAIQGNATYRINQWKMSSLQQEPQSTGNLWMGN